MFHASLEIAIASPALYPKFIVVVGDRVDAGKTCSRAQTFSPRSAKVSQKVWYTRAGEDEVFERSPGRCFSSLADQPLIVSQILCHRLHSLYF